MSDGNPVPGSLFYYAPNQGAAAFFTAIYAVSFIVHIWQCWRLKSWDLTGLLPFCALAFTAGFAVRIYCASNYQHANAFIASQFIVYATAPLLELANFHILGRIMYYVPYLSPIHPGRVLSTFLFLSCLVEVLNALGVMQSIVGTVVRTGTPEMERRVKEGHALMKAALILQISFAVLFVGLAAWFQRRCLQHGIRSRRVAMPLLTLYASMALITGRTVYRTVEHFAFQDLGHGGGGGPSRDPASVAPVVRFEWYFLAFEAALMFLALAVFNVFHPRRWLPERKTTYLAQDGVTELEGPGWDDKRMWIITLVDPFGLLGCIDRSTGKDGLKFWETNGFELRKKDAGGGSGGGSDGAAARAGAVDAV